MYEFIFRFVDNSKIIMKVEESFVAYVWDNLDPICDEFTKEVKTVFQRKVKEC